MRRGAGEPRRGRRGAERGLACEVDGDSDEVAAEKDGGPAGGGGMGVIGLEKEGDRGKEVWGGEVIRFLRQETDKREGGGESLEGEKHRGSESGVE